MLKHFIIAVVIAYFLRSLYFEFLKQQEKLVGIFRGEQERNNNRCPHNMFVRKHLCANCSSEEDALEISKRRVKFSPTVVNGVIFGNEDNNFWETVTNLHGHKTLCKNKVGMMHYTCNLKANRCRRNGKNCFTLHDTENGHFYYQKTVCTY